MLRLTFKPPFASALIMLILAFPLSAATIPDTLLGTPYRDDGVRNHQGAFATFNAPDQPLGSPGLNCSGLVVEVLRHFSPHPIRLTDAAVDRHSDSGSDATLGPDWDFGWDLIMNLSQSEENPRFQIIPTGRKVLPPAADGLSHRGFRFDNVQAWRQVLSHLAPNRLYLASLSRPTRATGYFVLHHHVGVILPQDDGIWFYHATAQKGVHRINIATQVGLDQLVSRFIPPRGTTSHIIVLESQYTN